MRSFIKNQASSLIVKASEIFGLFSSKSSLQSLFSCLIFRRRIITDNNANIWHRTQKLQKQPLAVFCQRLLLDYYNGETNLYVCKIDYENSKITNAITKILRTVIFYLRKQVFYIFVVFFS